MDGTIRYTMNVCRSHRGRGYWRAILFAVCLCLACIGKSVAAKTGKPHKEGRRAETKEIEALEEQWRNALLQADTGTLNKLLADDFLSVSSNGTLSDKQQYLVRLSSHTNRFTSLELIDLKVRVRPDSAVAVSQTHLIGSVEGHAVDGLFRNTRVYGRVANGQWRVLNSEATRVSGPVKDDGEMEGGKPLHQPSPVSP